jgi:methionyl-tRNA formyltransferase
MILVARSSKQPVSINVDTKVLFVGSKRVGLKVLTEMLSLHRASVVGVLSIDDRDDARTVYGPLQELAKKNSLPFNVAKNRREAAAFIIESSADLCIVAGWYWLLGQDILGLLRRGAVGIHFSKLPKYRGGSPVVWAIINGEREAGFSIFSFTKGMDDGPIWAQGVVPIEMCDGIADVLDKLESGVVTILRSTYLDILTETVSPVEQDPAEATFCTLRIPSDGLIDWCRPAIAVHDFIRAQSHPYPGAFSYLHNKKLTIWKTHPYAWPYYGTPGQVARTDDTGVYVVCGDARAIVLEIVEAEGQEVEAQKLIRSVKVRFPRAMLEPEPTSYQKHDPRT